MCNPTGPAIPPTTSTLSGDKWTGILGSRSRHFANAAPEGRQSLAVGASPPKAYANSICSRVAATEDNFSDSDVLSRLVLLAGFILSAIGCEPPLPPPAKPAAKQAIAPTERSFKEQVRDVEHGGSDTIESESQPVSDDDLTQLSKLTGLHKLVLKKADISDAGLKHLARLTEITTLVLGETSVTDDGLNPILGMTNLAVLNFASTEVTAGGLKKLSTLKHLNLLRFGRSKVGDEGLASVRRMPELTTLILQNSPITDAGLEQLLGFDQLKNLYIEGSQVTDEGAGRLQESLPHLHFHW